LLRRKTFAAAAVMALAGSALVAGPATAATKTLTVKGGEEFLPNGAGLLVKLRFAPRPLEVKRGDTVRINDRTGVGPEAEPHSISFARKREIPQSFADYAPNRRTGPLVGRLMAAHKAPDDGPPEFLNVMNFQPAPAGAALEANGRGDSFFWQGKANAPSFKVTAAKGRTLNYFCLVHAWMNGQIVVR
jgi:plastocyanin